MNTILYFISFLLYSFSSLFMILGVVTAILLSREGFPDEAVYCFSIGIVIALAGFFTYSKGDTIK